MPYRSGIKTNCEIKNLPTKHANGQEFIFTTASLPDLVTNFYLHRVLSEESVTIDYRAYNC